MDRCFKRLPVIGINQGIVGLKRFIHRRRRYTIGRNKLRENMTDLVKCKAFVDSAGTKNVNVKFLFWFCGFQLYLGGEKYRKPPSGAVKMGWEDYHD